MPHNLEFAYKYRSENGPLGEGLIWMNPSSSSPEDPKQAKAIPGTKANSKANAFKFGIVTNY